MTLKSLRQRYLEQRSLRVHQGRARVNLDRFLAFQKALGGSFDEIDQPLLDAYGQSEGYRGEAATELRMWLRYLLRHGHLPQPWHQEVPMAIRFPYQRRPVPTHSEVLRLLALPDLDEVQGLWDRAVWEVVYSSGLRASELVGLDLEDVDLAAGTLHLRKTKNRWERMVPLTRPALDFLRRYLQEVRPTLRNEFSGSALWLGRRGRRSDRHSPTMRLRSYPQEELFGRVYTLHCLRHACATRLLQNGANLRLVQVLLGHRELKSTQHYTEVTPFDLVTMHQRHHPRSAL